MIRIRAILALLFAIAACDGTAPADGQGATGVSAAAGGQSATGGQVAAAEASGPSVARQCAFDSAALAFAGTPEAQARCLLAPVGIYAHLGPPLQSLPPGLGARVGRPADIARAGFRAYLAASRLTEASVGGDLAAPVSSTPGGQRALYFVIRDTSSPYFGNDAFPADLNASARVNDLGGYRGPQVAAHLFVNRRGETYLGHDFAVPWRATKRERQLPGGQLRGRFLHVELVQPRRRDPAGGARNDAIAPSQASPKPSTAGWPRPTSRPASAPAHG